MWSWCFMVCCRDVCVLGDKELCWGGGPCLCFPLSLQVCGLALMQGRRGTAGLGVGWGCL